MSASEGLHGLLAEFPDPDALVEAATSAYDEGYRKLDAYSPVPIHGLAKALHLKANRLPWVVFFGGLTGCVGGFLFQYWVSVVDYPLNVGGRPLNSWPAFVPVSFELTILFAALATVLGMLALNGLPRPHHPLFNSDRFQLASKDKFFLCIEARDPRFQLEATRRFLEELGADEVTEVEE